MSKPVRSFERFVGGIADYDSEGIESSFAFGRSVDHRTDPSSITILPRTIKESGTVITDLPKWGETYSNTLDTYVYGNAGNLYKRTSAGSNTFLRTVASSHGNGLSYFGEDDFLYYTGDKVIGRYGPLTGTPQFSDDFLGAQGGVPLNTNSLDLESTSSQYADRADTASLSITGNIAMDIQIKPESLPTVGNTMVLMSKWNINGNLRSYMFDIAAVSGYFGDGSDGVLTISSNTTEAPIDSACTGTSGTTSLSATNASFTAGQIIMIHYSQGTSAGTWQRTTISGYTAGTITTADVLNATYGTGSQVRVLKQHTNVTVNTGITYTTKAWNGTVGGILAFIASGTVTVTGTISANGSTPATPYTGSGATGGGFRGGSGTQGFNVTANQGEGTTGTGSASTAANGNGGGGGQSGAGSAGDGSFGTGGSGGNGTAGGSGITGTPAAGATAGSGGATAGSADLTTIVFGGGSGGVAQNSSIVQAGGSSGGGIVFITGTTVTITGAITSNGGRGAGDGASNSGGGGGSILLKAQTATLGAALITAAGGTVNSSSPGGSVGGVGRIHLDYYTSYTGTTTPTLDVTQDNNLVTNTTYQLRLSVSSTGTNSETMAQTFSPQTGMWQGLGVSWTASTSTAIFYQNAVAIGTRTGTLTAIADTTARFAVGASFNSGGSAANFFDGLVDEARLFNTTRTSTDFFNGLSQQILTTTAGLAAYYKFNGAATDSTANANDLTLQNVPVYSTDVPYPSPTTRLDIDQSATTAGNTYTTPTAISEAVTARKTFTPAKDPQKSIAVLIAAVGTGNWTITVHDQYNNSVATLTVANASMATGYYEFVFTTPWRPQINASYHFHLTSTVADGTVTTTGAGDLETVSYRTYFQFLVTDTAWHPITKMLQFLVFGNERYVGKWEATLYYPNHITLAANEKVRCFGKWGEYLAIGIMKGSSITDFDQGRVYFWDGIAPTYNFFIDVPEGGINALYGVKDTLYIWAGYQGDMLVYRGGATAKKIKRVPLIEANKYMEVYPGAVNMWKALLRFGSAGGTDSTTIQQGVYTYGSLNERYPESLSYDYPVSTGTLTGTNLKIGLVMAVGSKLLVGYQDNTAYGLDYVDAANAPYPTATIEFLVQNEDTAWKQKEANVLVANFNPLVSGESVLVKYKIDAESSFTSNPDGATTTANAIESRQEIGNGRYYRYQVAADLATTTTTAPTMHCLAIETDQKETEKRV